MAELEPEVIAEIKKAVSESFPKPENPKELKFTADELTAHQEDCNNPDCPACQGMFKKINSEKISNLAQRVDNLIEKKKFNEINKDKYNSCVKEKTHQCEKKYATASRLQKLRLGIGKRVAGSKSI